MPANPLGRKLRFAKEYFHQGDLIAVTGRIVTESYKKAGDEKNSFFTCVQVGRSYFARRKGEEQARTRTMRREQDGKAPVAEDHAPFLPMEEEDYGEFPPLPQEEYADFPPLPQEEEFPMEMERTPG